MKLNLRFSGPWLAGATALVLAACASNPENLKPPGADESRALQADTSRLGFSLVYLVHGDAGYAYHDDSGKLRAADEDAVAGALDVAKGSTEGEVFIFHQRKSSSRWYHGGSDGFLTQYRRGRLLRAEGYSRRESGVDFGAETALYRRYAARSERRFFVYCGHEIPLREGAGYSSSYPDRNFSLAEFRRGLQGFVPGPGRPRILDARVGDAPIKDAPIKDGAEKPFSLVVLSTCRGGTPETISALSKDADFVIASPADLHLSYFDTHAFLELSRPNPFAQDVFPHRLDSASRVDSAPFTKPDPRALARAIASQSFRRLKASTQTEVTVAIYDVVALRLFLEQAGRYRAQDLERGRVDGENCGGETGPVAGVEMLYQPPRFGKNKDRATRSGWECGG